MPSFLLLSSCLIDWFSSSNNPFNNRTLSKKGQMTSKTEYSLSPTYLVDVLFKVKCCPLLTFSLLVLCSVPCLCEITKDSHTHLLPDNNFRHRFRGYGKDEFSFLPLNFGGAFKQNLMKEGRELNLF